MCLEIQLTIIKILLLLFSKLVPEYMHRVDPRRVGVLIKLPSEKMKSLTFQFKQLNLWHVLACIYM